MKKLSVLFLVPLASQAVAAAGYELSWARSSAGTLLSEPVGSYELSATAGQPEAGGVEGCAVSVKGGFWVAAAAANPPPAEGDTADLALSIEESADPVRVGSEVTFTLRVTNLGPATATGVMLTNTLPANMEVVSVASLRPYTITGNSLVAELGTINVSACAEIQVVLRAGPIGLYTIPAEVGAEQTDPDPANNIAVQATTVFDGEIRSFTWTGAGSSSQGWDDPRNWAPSIPNPPWTSTNGPPGLADTAIIPAGRGEVRLRRDVTVGSLILETTLVSSNTLTVAREGAWRGGGLNGSDGFATLAIAPGARFELEGAGAKVLSVARVVNGGHLVWSGTGRFDNTDRGGEVYNLRGATFEIRTGAPLGWSGYSRLKNEGRMIKEGGDQVMDLAVVNEGLLELRSGVSQIRNAFTNRSRLVIGPGAALQLPSRAWVSGQVDIGTNGNLTFLWNASGANQQLVDARLSGEGTVQKSIPGDLFVSGNVTATHFEITSGTLRGSGTLTVTETMRWTGGAIEMVGGRLVIAPGAVLTLDGASEKRLGGTLQNGGTMIWDGPGALVGADGPLIHNLATGLIEARSDAPLTTWNAFPTLNNEGVFRKSSSGDKTMKLNVNNRGRFEALAGSLLIQDTRFNNHGVVELNGGVTLTLGGGGTNSGAFSLPDTARLAFAGDALKLHLLQQGVTFSGSGMVEVGGLTSGPQLVVDGEVSIPHFAVASGRLTGAGRLTVTETMRWTGGAIEMVGGTLVIAPGAVLMLDGASEKRLGGTLQNGGTMIWDGPGAFVGASGPLIHNLATGLIEARSDAQLTWWNGPATLNNEGVFRKSSSGDKTMVLNVNNRGRFEALAGSLLIQDTRFNNEAQVELTNGAVLTLRGGGTNRGSFVLGEATRLVFPGSTYYLEQGAAITGPGKVELTAGGLWVNGEVPLANFVMRGGNVDGPGALTITETMSWTGGFIALRAGGLVIGPSASVVIDGAAEKWLGGKLSNAGQVVWQGSGLLFGQGGLLISNLPTGVIEARSEALLIAIVVNNAGVFRKVNGPGTKTLNAQFVNSGRLELPAGVLQVNGNFTNAPEGTVSFALGSPPGEGNYGALAVSGRAQLDGTLEVALTNGFRPALSNQFQVITANPRAGTFSAERGMQLDGGLKLTPVYAASSVALLVTNAPVETPVVLTLDRVGEWLRLSWLPALTNVTVLSTEDLATGAWSEFARPATNLLWVSPTNEHRFFRVRQP